MGSKKGSAKAKRLAEFRASLESFDSGVDDAFAREAGRKQRRAEEHEAALRKKACESKNRYCCKSDAEAAIASCAAYGTTGLHAYRCPYCNGWHLTSKPERPR